MRIVPTLMTSSGVRFSLVVVAGLSFGCANGGYDATDALLSGAPSDSDADAPQPPRTRVANDAGKPSGSLGGGSDAGLAAADGGKTLADAGVAADGEAGASCATVPPSNTCGPVPQCGCAPNQTCDVTSDTTGATTCVASGSGALGSSCTSTGGCARGLTCVGGACRPYCATAGQSCGIATLGTCFAPEYAPGKTTPNRDVCTIRCDPRASATACGTNGCSYFPVDKVTDCRAVGQKKQFDACGSIFECAPGFTCNAHPIYGPECEKWCRTSADCPNLTACYDIFGANAPVINGVKYGLCLD